MNIIAIYRSTLFLKFNQNQFVCACVLEIGGDAFAPHCYMT